MKIKNKLFLLFVLIFSISFSQNLTLEIYSNIGQENDIISGINYNKNFDTFEELKNEVDNTNSIKVKNEQGSEFEKLFNNQKKNSNVQNSSDNTGNLEKKIIDKIK